MKQEISPTSEVYFNNIADSLAVCVRDKLNLLKKKKQKEGVTFDGTKSVVNLQINPLKEKDRPLLYFEREIPSHEIRINVTLKNRQEKNFFLSVWLWPNGHLQGRCGNRVFHGDIQAIAEQFIDVAL
jgi:hypothetical protein